MGKQLNNKPDEITLSRAQIVEISGGEEAFEAAMELASSLDSIADY